jgi:polyisoprenoid-binding protein YceI
MTFKSSKVVRKSKDSGVAHGTFTLKGVSKEIAIPFKLYGPITDTRQKQRIGVEASVTINRQDYGIAYNGKLPDGALAVSNDVNITLLLEAVKQ